MKKSLAVVLGLFVGAAILAGTLTNREGGVNVLIGWVPYLKRVLPQVSPDPGTVVVGAGAFLVFAAGVQLLGVRWSRNRPVVEGPARPRWRLRSTASVVVLVCVLFATGVLMIGLIHQTGWLIRSEQPMMIESNWSRRSSPQDERINPRMIAMGISNYESSHNKLPEGGTVAPDGTMLHGWAVGPLNYMGYYHPSELDLKRPWNHPANQMYFKCVIPQYINPGLRGAPVFDVEGYGLNHYSANSHVMGANRTMSASQITDGASNTLLIGEVNHGFKPWGHPLNFRDPTTGINKPNGFGGSANRRGAAFVMADGSVRVLSERISPDILRALSTPNAGDAIREEGWEKW